MKTARILSVALIALVLSPPARAQNALKIFISIDMEGLAGVVSDAQLGPEGFEYERFRQFMTDELNAAIDGAREAGATEFLVADSHGNGLGVLIEQLPDDVQIIRSWPRPLGMLEGIDETFDGAFFIGYHASTTNMQGVRAHTMSSANVTDFKINGVSVPEAGMGAAIAGHFGVPVILITGDSAIIEEAHDLIGDFEEAIVKWPISFHSARTLTPAAAAELIRTKARAAVRRIGDFKPFRIDGPVTFDLSLKHYRPVELLGYLPIVERVDSHTIRYVGEDILAVSQFLEFVLQYSVSVQP